MRYSLRTSNTPIVPIKAMDGRTMTAPASVTTPSISLVLPAYNEAEAIERAIIEADSALRKLTDDYEIIVVDDGSRDDTSTRVSQLATRFPAVRLERHEVNRGYGAALRTGFAACTKDLLVFTDADSQFDLRELDRHLLLSRDYDIVCGYRIDRQDPWLRCFYSRVYNLIVQTFLGTGIRDVDCAMKMFRREVFQQIEPAADGFLINAETITLARQAGLRVVEVGVTHRPRVQGRSTVSIRHIPVVFTSLLRFWWNQVFCGRDVSLPRDLPNPRSRIASSNSFLLLMVSVLVASALLLNLGYPLIARDETRYAEIPREMIVSGDWLVPRLNFQPYFDKPPLFYWLGAISYQLFGISESSVRLVPAISACFLVILVTWFAWRKLGRSSGVWSGLVLFTTAGFVFCSRFLIIDILLAALTTAASFAMFHAVSRDRIHWGWWVSSAVLCGLGLLTKGPISVVLVLPPVVMFAWLKRPVASPSLVAWILWLIVASSVAVPWFLAVQGREPTFAYEFFVHHNVARFAGAFHPQPWWYYLPVVLIGGHPWTFLTIPFMQFLLSRRPEFRRQRPPIIGYCALQAFWCVVFFSCSKCKLPAYILPAAPFFAILIGHYMATRFDGVASTYWERVAQRLAPYWAIGASSLVGVVVAGVGFGFVPLGWTAIAVVTWVGILLGSWKFSRLSLLPKKAWVMAGLTAGILFIQIMHVWLPRWAADSNRLAVHSKAFHLATNSENAVATFGDELSAVPYYSKRSDVRNFMDADQLMAFVRTRSKALVVFDEPSQLTHALARSANDIKVRAIDERHGVYELQCAYSGRQESTSTASRPGAPSY